MERSIQKFFEFRLLLPNPYNRSPLPSPPPPLKGMSSKINLVHVGREGEHTCKGSIFFSQDRDAHTWNGVTEGFPLAREISGSTNMGTWTINNCSLAVGRRFIRAHSRARVGLDPIVGWKLGCAFGVEFCAFVPREWSMAVVCPIGEKKRSLEGFELEMGQDVKGIFFFFFRN